MKHAALRLPTALMHTEVVKYFFGMNYLEQQQS